MESYDILSGIEAQLPRDMGTRRSLAQQASKLAKAEYDDPRPFGHDLPVDPVLADVVKIAHATDSAIDAVFGPGGTAPQTLTTESRRWLVYCVIGDLLKLDIDEYMTALIRPVSPARWFREYLAERPARLQELSVRVKEWFVDPFFVEDKATDGPAGYKGINLALLAPRRGVAVGARSVLDRNVESVRAILEIELAKFASRWPVLLTAGTDVGDQARAVAEMLQLDLSPTEKRELFAAIIPLRADGVLIDATCGIPEKSFVLEQLRLFSEFARTTGAPPRTALILTADGRVPDELRESGRHARLVPVTMAGGAITPRNAQSLSAALHTRLPEFAESAWWRRNLAFQNYLSFETRMIDAVTNASDAGRLDMDVYRRILHASFVDLGWLPAS